MFSLKSSWLLTLKIKSKIKDDKKLYSKEKETIVHTVYKIFLDLDVQEIGRQQPHKPRRINSHRSICIIETKNSSCFYVYIGNRLFNNCVLLRILDPLHFELEFYHVIAYLDIYTSDSLPFETSITR